MSSGQGKNPGLSGSGQRAASGAAQPAGEAQTSQQSDTGTTGNMGTTPAGTPSQRRPASSVGLQDTSTSSYESTGQGYSRGTEAGYREETGGDVAAYTGSVLAATLMILTGLLAFFAGLSALVRRSYYYATIPNHYAYQWNIRGWGWALLILGVLIFAAGACIMLGMTWARVVGVGLAVLTAIGAFMFLPYSPVWSIVLIALSVFVIWSLLHKGADESADAL
jgi:hypothetical protein